MEEFLVEKKERGGYTLKIYHDFDARNPFDEFDQATTLVFDARNYDFGSRHVDFTEATGYDRDDFRYRIDTGDERTVDEDKLLVRWMRLSGRAVATIGIGFSDHGSGGASMTAYGESTTEVSEFAFISPEDYENMIEPRGSRPDERDHAIKIMQAEVGEFGKYLRGEVFGYVVEDPDGEHLDSCWGFYGMRYAEEEADRAFKEAIRQHKLERWEKVGIDPCRPDYGLIPS